MLFVLRLYFGNLLGNVVQEVGSENNPQLRNNLLFRQDFAFQEVKAASIAVVDEFFLGLLELMEVELEIHRLLGDVGEDLIRR